MPRLTRGRNPVDQFSRSVGRRSSDCVRVKVFLSFIFFLFYNEISKFREFCFAVGSFLPFPFKRGKKRIVDGRRPRDTRFRDRPRALTNLQRLLETIREKGRRFDNRRIRLFDCYIRATRRSLSFFFFFLLLFFFVFGRSVETLHSSHAFIIFSVFLFNFPTSPLDLPFPFLLLLIRFF